MRAGRGRARSSTLFRGHYNIPLVHVDAQRHASSPRSPASADPEEKRKTIGRLFIDVFEEEAKKIGGADFLAQGTLYPDVIESVSALGGPSVTIKSHHNVGGLPERMKHEAGRAAARAVQGRGAGARPRARPAGGLRRPPPVPGPGLAIRCPARSPARSSTILRKADAIYLDEIRKAGLYDAIWQAFAVLLPVQTVGVMGDGRTYDYVLRAPRRHLDRRHDRRLLSLRHGLPRPRRDPHHQRGQGHQPRRLRRDLEAARHDRVGVAGISVFKITRSGCSTRDQSSKRLT